MCFSGEVTLYVSASSLNLTLNSLLVCFSEGYGRSVLRETMIINLFHLQRWHMSIKRFISQ